MQINVSAIVDSAIRNLERVRGEVDKISGKRIELQSKVSEAEGKGGESAAGGMGAMLKHLATISGLMTILTGAVIMMTPPMQSAIKMFMMLATMFFLPFGMLLFSIIAPVFRSLMPIVSKMSAASMTSMGQGTMATVGGFAMAGAAVGSIVPGLGTILGAIVGALLGGVVALIVGSIPWRNVWDWIKAEPKAIWEWVTKTSKDIFDWINDTSKPIFDWITDESKPIFDWILETSRDIWYWISENSRDIWFWVTDNSRDIWHWVTDASRDVWHWISDNSRSIWHWITESSKSVWSWITTSVKSVWDFIATPIKSIWDFITGGGGYGRSYQEGTNYVPQTGIYMLHQGEKVVPSGGSGGEARVNVFKPTYVFSGQIKESVDVDELVRKTHRISELDMRRRGLI